MRVIEYHLVDMTVEVLKILNSLLSLENNLPPTNGLYPADNTGLDMSGEQLGDGVKRKWGNVIYSQVSSRD